jgi:hypothetical protein
VSNTCATCRPVSGEKLFVSRHQPRLPDSGARLLFGNGIGPLVISERAHARANRARRNDDDFFPRLPKRSDLRHELTHLRRIGLLASVREHGGAELHDDSFGVFEQLVAHSE